MTFEPMPTDSEILQSVQAAFAECPRPDHFIDYTHCEECAEHDEVLRARDLHTLQIADVGNVCWDPVCFISPQGFAYYLPALVRLALAEPVEPYGWYAEQLLWHLCSDGARNERVLGCTPEQRKVVVEFLNHLAEARASLVDYHLCTDELFQAMEIWSDGAAT
jgi:hypothetical protein